jgi:hypothetical protein
MQVSCCSVYVIDGIANDTCLYGRLLSVKSTKKLEAADTLILRNESRHAFDLSRFKSVMIDLLLARFGRCIKIVLRSENNLNMSRKQLKNTINTV